MITMLLGGLWHGANWNFVIWGGYHGTLLSLERMLGRDRLSRFKTLYPIQAALTFCLVSIGWIFFRAATLKDSLHVIRQLLSGIGGQMLIPVWLLVLAGIALISALAEEKWEWMERLPRGPAWAYVTALIALLFCVELIGVTEKAVPFVYFQF